MEDDVVAYPAMKRLEIQGKSEEEGEETVVQSNSEGTDTVTESKCCIPAMLPAKLSYFLYSSMTGAYANYQNIFLRDVGLSIEETGFISGSTFVVMALVSPLWGLLIDYTGRRKLIFLILFLGQISCVFSSPFIAGLISPIDVGNRTVHNVTKASKTISEKSKYGKFSSTLFLVMFFVEIGSKICIAPLHAMIDAAVMNVIEVKEPRATFGEQRVFGSLSFGLFAFISGCAVDQFGSYFENQHQSKYTIVYIIFLPIAFITLPMCLYLLNQMDLPQTSNTRSESKIKLAVSTFCNLKNMMFLVTVFMVGLSSMTFVAYLYIMMRDKMHSTRTIMGISGLIQSLAQVFVFPFGNRIVDMCGGTIPSLELAILSYGIRYIANSYILNPWLIILTQMLHCAGFSLFWVAAVEHTQKIAPKQVYVTMFTIINGAYYGMGGLSANMLGGVIYGHFGADALFRGMGILGIIWTVAMFFCFQLRDFTARLRARVYPISG